MKKYSIFLMFLVVVPIMASLTNNSGSHNLIETSVNIPIKPIESLKPIEIEIKKPKIESDLVYAMIQVESLGNDSAIGDKHLVGEEAVGALQIRPIMIREVNRILKLKKSEIRYKRKDRFSRKKSIEMFLIWKEFHHKDSDFEKIARNWNGGPRGYKKSRTEYYWKKVEAELNK
jgi:hypothetical protein